MKGIFNDSFTERILLGLFQTLYEMRMYQTLNIPKNLLSEWHWFKIRKSLNHDVTWKYPWIQITERSDGRKVICLLKQKLDEKYENSVS